MLPIFEGRVNHMYLDTAGVVTCGVGCALRSKEEAVARFADPAAAAEWAVVLAMPRGMGPDYYVARTKLRMSDRLIDTAFDIKTNWAGIELYAYAKEHETWPAGAIDACLDISYNCGSIAGFPEMLAAIRAGEWRKAAEQSFREPPVAELRNNWTRDAILSAIQEVVT
jgi:GH24 family phage-related lysozyme (muramidase)